MVSKSSTTVGQPRELGLSTRNGQAMPTVVTAVGLVAAFAGVEHGIGELSQPLTDSGSIMIESWPHVAAFEPLSGEPAMTLIPELRVSGVLTISLSIVLGWVALRARVRRRDGWLLLGVSLLLLLVGGGFGPPLLGAVLGIGLLRAAGARSDVRPPSPVSRALARWWRPMLFLCLGTFLALFPGVVLLRWATGFDSAWLPALLPAVAFTSLILTLAGALTHDRAIHGGRVHAGSSVADRMG